MFVLKTRHILAISSVALALTVSSCGEQTTGLTLVAGQERTHTDGTRNVTKFALPHGIAINNSDVMFVVDAASHTIRSVNKSGTTATLAGSAYQAGSANGVGSAARFDHPIAITFDKVRNRLYVVDAGNNTIRMIKPNGTVTTLAGVAGVAGYANGAGTQAKFSFSELIEDGLSYSKINLDQSGNIFVTDSVGLRKITPNGVVSTYFAATTNYTDKTTQVLTPVVASYPAPTGIDVKNASFVIDSANSFWFAASYALQQVTSTGVIGTRLEGLSSGAKMAINANNEIFSYYGDNNESHLIKTNTTTNQTTVIWQQGAIQPSMAFEDAAVLSAIAVDSTGMVYGADPINAIVRRYATDGTVSVFSGLTPLMGARNGAALRASFALPNLLTSDLNGNIYIAETIPTIRRINIANNQVITLAGKGSIDGWSSVDGLKNNAGFKQVTGIVFNPIANSIYILDQQSNSTLLRQMTTGGNVTTVSLTTPISQATQGLTVNTTDGLMYVADGTQIKQITRAGVVSTLAGNPSTIMYQDGVAQQASFIAPNGLIADSQNNLYTIDSGAMRKITNQGVVSTMAGVYNQYGKQDGNFANARFGKYASVSGSDKAGVVYVRDCDVGDVQLKLLQLTPNQSCVLRKVDTVTQTVSTTSVSIPSSAGLLNVHFTANGNAYTTFEHGVFRLNLN